MGHPAFGEGTRGRRLRDRLFLQLSGKDALKVVFFYDGGLVYLARVL